MVYAYNNGNKIYYDESDCKWKYYEDDTIVNNDNMKKCPVCNSQQTKEGYDACLGHLEGVMFACCGHGVQNPYAIFNDGTYIEFNNLDEILRLNK